jgi:hypothetical protein
LVWILGFIKRRIKKAVQEGLNRRISGEMPIFDKNLENNLRV